MEQSSAFKFIYADDGIGLAHCFLIFLSHQGDTWQKDHGQKSLPGTSLFGSVPFSAKQECGQSRVRMAFL